MTTNQMTLVTLAFTILGFFWNFIAPVYTQYMNRKTNEKDMQRDEVLSLWPALRRLAPCRVSFDDNMEKSLEACRALLEIAEQLWDMMQGSFSGISRASKYRYCLLQPMQKHLFSLRKNKIAYDPKVFAEMYEDAYDFIDCMIGCELHLIPISEIFELTGRM